MIRPVVGQRGHLRQVFHLHVDSVGATPIQHIAGFHGIHRQVERVDIDHYLLAMGSVVVFVDIFIDIVRSIHDSIDVVESAGDRRRDSDWRAIVCLVASGNRHAGIVIADKRCSVQTKGGVA